MKLFIIVSIIQLIVAIMGLFGFWKEYFGIRGDNILFGLWWLVYIINFGIYFYNI